MDAFFPKVYLIDDKWVKQPWYNTGGTREKKYIISPEGKYFYFKKSERKPAKGSLPEKYYKYEFWSEIIAYNIGTLCGFNVLRYDVGIENDAIGCMCESMINSEKEELIEGLSYLQGYNPTFNPELYENRTKYTFQLIEDTFNHFKLEKFFPDFLKMLVFDALIGNTDRHQENWAIICEYTAFTKVLQSALHKVQGQQNKGFGILQNARLSQERKRLFSPLYDNGSSLARELSNEKITQIFIEDSSIVDYITKGKSEIHWNEIKITHFSMLANLLKSEHSDTIRVIVKQLVLNFSYESVKRIIGTIDDAIPDSHKMYKIPNERKKLIEKIITLRFEKIKELLSERF